MPLPSLLTWLLCYRPTHSLLSGPSAVLVDNHKVALQIKVKYHKPPSCSQVRLRCCTPGTSEDVYPNLLILQMVTLRLRDRYKLPKESRSRT